MIEEWRPVVGFEGLYSISSLGRVRSEPRVVIRKGHSLTIHGRIRTAPLNRNGYPAIQLWRGNNNSHFEVHVLVAAAFIGPRPAGMQILHEDGVRTNARVNNLSYGTPQQNFADSVRHGTDTRAERNHLARLSNADALKIRNSTARNVDLAKAFGVAQQTICNIRKGRRYASA